MYSFQGDIPRECIVRYWAFLSAPLFLEKDRTLDLKQALDFSR